MIRAGRQSGSHGVTPASQEVVEATTAAAPADASAQLVEVPAYAGTLAPPERDRIRLLRRNLVEAMRHAREIKPRRGAADRPAPEPTGFVGQVARAACALCRGWCCSKGGEHAYLDGPSLARIRRARPDLDAWGILRLYTGAVADPAYAGSCVFHGAQGCTLDRALRSNLCNEYFCNGLSAVVKQGRAPARAMVVAARDEVRRTSALVSPEDESAIGK